jgi:hypothetical protein
MSCLIYSSVSFYFLKQGAGRAQSLWRRDTGWTAEELGFDSRKGKQIFLFSTAPRPGLGHTQSPIQWVPQAKAAGEWKWSLSSIWCRG